MDKPNSENEPWYAVRSVFYHEDNKVYEERIVLFEAAEEEEALKLAEKEAIQYAEDLNHVTFTGFLDSYHIFEEKIESGSEVFSLMRESDLPREEYLNRFFATGSERSRIVD